jgi:hypothetical protein
MTSNDKDAPTFYKIDWLFWVVSTVLIVALIVLFRFLISE